MLLATPNVASKNRDDMMVFLGGCCRTYMDSGSFSHLKRVIAILYLVMPKEEGDKGSQLCHHVCQKPIGQKVNYD